MGSSGMRKEERGWVRCCALVAWGMSAPGRLGTAKSGSAPSKSAVCNYPRPNSSSGIGATVVVRHEESDLAICGRKWRLGDLVQCGASSKTDWPTRVCTVCGSRHGCALLIPWSMVIITRSFPPLPPALITRSVVVQVRCVFQCLIQNGGHPNSRHVGRCFPKSCQLRRASPTNLGTCRSNLAELGPIFAELHRIRAIADKNVLNSPNIDQCGLDSGKFGSISIDVGPNSFTFTFAQIRSGAYG